MGLSFAQSVQQNSTEQTANTVAVASVDPEVMVAAEEVVWTQDEKYAYYPEYSDSNVSTVDADKNIVVNNKQINITQETNSQFIPFLMDRYYDGVDLFSKTIVISFKNRDGNIDFAAPINVSYSNDKIKFAWLVDARVTAVEGEIQFEIQAVGVNSKGDEYVWRTKPNGKLNVLKALSGNGVIEPDSTWMAGFLNQMSEFLSGAQAAAQEAKTSVDDAAAYATQAEESAKAAQDAVDTAKSELEADVQTAVDEKVDEKMGVVLEDYYDKTEVDTLISNIDISDQLADIENENASQATAIQAVESDLSQYKVATDADLAGIHETIDDLPTTLATDYYTKTATDETFATKEGLVTVSNRASATQEELTAYKGSNDSAVAQVQKNLDDYAQITDEDLAGIHEAIDGLPETLASDYYTKEVTDQTFAKQSSLAELQTKISANEGAIETNKTSIGTLGNKVAELEGSIGNIDQSPRLSYEATYDEEYKFTLWEIEGEGDEEERTAKSQFVIQGGSGGGTSSVLKIEYVTKTPLVATVDDQILITYNFSGTDSSGDAVMEGAYSWKIGNTVIATGTAVSGENTFDITKYINLGTQKVTLVITDDAGSLVTKSWSVQKIDVRLESSFNDTLTYPIGSVSFDYTPYGAISKDVHFVLDGKEIGKVTTSASGIPMAYTIPVQEHGAHLLEAYMTATVNNNTIESNHVLKDIIWYDSTSSVPVISTVSQKFTARQYDTTNISYTVYDPKTETPTVTLAVDGNEISTRQMESTTEVWQFKSADIGTHTLTITCGETVKTLTATIEKLDIEIEPVTAGLVVDFDPTGKTNSDADREWTNGTYSMKASDNFDWVTGGYQFDEVGDQYFCIKAGTSVELDYQLFADDAKRNGKEMKLIFKTTNVQAPDAKFLTCVDNTTETNHIGIEMFVHEAYIYGQSNKLDVAYSEEDIIEFEFNISKDIEDIPLVMAYEDGVSTRPMVYDDSSNFTQTTPKTITLGSDKCDLHIYRMKIYNTSLTARGILNNFIADARNAEEMVARYERNQIYDENNMLDPDVLAEKCPDLRVIKISCPYFTNSKSDKVPGTTIQHIYKNGDPVLDNWTAYDCQVSGQGTSSNNYGAAARNLDLIMNKSGVDGVKPHFVLGDGKTEATEISMTRKEVPVAYLNFKANVASSNNMTNAMLANRYNDFNPYKRPFVRDEGVDTSIIRDTMYFENCVVFIQEYNEDLSTHREFADNDWHRKE